MADKNHSPTLQMIKRFLPLFLILIGMILVRYHMLTDYLSFEALKEHREALLEQVDTHPVSASLTYTAVYIATVALSIPGGAFLSMIGGFLFPQPFSTLLVVTSATIGATLIFLSAKTALGEGFKAKINRKLDRIQKGIEEDGAYYLLFLRLVPLFPFWLVNLAPAFLNVSLSTFVWTTFVGIIPGAFVFTQAGTGIGAILNSDQGFTLNAVFNTQMKIALAVIGLFVLLPLIIKKIRKKRIDNA